MTVRGALPSHVRVVVIGAGFGGLGMVISLRKKGVEDVLVLERSGSVGGTWRDNTYPGCACDIPSRVYSFSFAQNSQWSYSYSRQPEILSYLERVAEELGVLPSIRFHTEVTAADWDEAAQLWRIRTTRGDLTSQFLVVAAGVLAEPALPSVPGIESFAGPAFHSARWDHDVDWAGKRVVVVGTGASAIQFVPYLQRKAAQVTVFQRTAPWVLPKRSVRVSERTKAFYRRVPGAQQLARAAVYAQLETTVAAFLNKGPARAIGEKRGREHLAAQVSDPVLRKVLTPQFALGCKRVLLSNTWYPALCSDNVTVVPHAVREITPISVVAGDGTVHDADVIVLGTGFHPLEVPVARCITGRGGRTLSEEWGDKPTAHRGTTVHGFPNLFFLLGPNTALGHNSVVLMMEAQTSYVLDALTHLEGQGASSLDVRAAAQQSYNATVQSRLAGTVWSSGGCDAWYTSDDGFNFVVWPGSVGAFKKQMARFDAEAYELVVGTPHLETV